MVLQLGVGMQIRVRKWYLKRITLDVEADDSIDSVKAQIQHKEGTPTYLQCLMFEDMKLSEGRTLSTYGIQSESTLDLVIRAGGGKGKGKCDRKAQFEEDLEAEEEEEYEGMDTHQAWCAGFAKGLEKTQRKSRRRGHGPTHGDTGFEEATSCHVTYEGHLPSKIKLH